MADFDEGPSRRVSRGRKKTSDTIRVVPDITSEKDAGKNPTKDQPNKVSPLKQSDWFCNSFGSRKSHQEKKKITSPHRGAKSVPKSPKVRKGRRESMVTSPLNSSDALLAELDIENVSSYINQSAASLQHSTNQNQIDISHTEQSYNRQKKPDDLNTCSRITRKSASAVRKNTNITTDTTVDELSRVTPNSEDNDTLQTSVSESQSQYFPSKFGNYKPSQPNQNVVKKEVVVGNKVARNNTHFNFSFVGCDTQDDDCDERVTNRKKDFVNGKSVNEPAEEISEVTGQKHRTNNAPRRYCTRQSLADTFSDTQVRSVKVNSEIQSSTDWDNKEILSSTQFCTTQINSVETETHSKCMGTPFRNKDIGPINETQTQLGNVSGLFSQTQNCENTNIDITLLKDTCDRNEFKYRCTPYKAAAKERCTQSQISTQASLICTSQFKSLSPENVQSTQINDTCEEGGNFKYRCTPYNTKDKDSCTQPQSSLVSNTQYHSYLHDMHTQNDCIETTQGNSKELYRFPPTQSRAPGIVDSQIQSTGLCDMTGFIVDSQDAVKDMNTSNCDMFGDSFHDPDLLSQVDELDHKHSQKHVVDQIGNRKIGSESKRTNHDTHNSVYGKSAILGNNTNKKRSLDDDLESISQESRKRRSLGKQKYGSLNHEDSNVSGDNSKLLDSKKVASETGSNKNMKIDREHSTSHVQVNAMTFGSKLKSGNGETTQLETSVPVTPGGAGTLQERIKQRLMQNAGQRTPQGPGSLVERMREQVLERVQIEAELRKDATNHDVGPFYGLPSKVKHLFERDRGIKSLYDWQDECLKLPAVLERKNLIYSLPTSGGKTLVAEILILQELLCHKRDALLILPFVSIVQEKVRNMSQFAVELDFHVEEYAGSKGRFPPIKRWKSRSLYIATIEKAQSIVNSLMEGERSDELGLVVVDELHMIGEGGSRGATLEATMMKILHCAGPTQIIGMSATLNNIADLQQFLHAETYSNDFRPVQLTEHIKLSDNIYKIDGKAKCQDDQFLHDRVVCFQYLPDMEKVDPDHLLGLVLEVIPDNSCLVFCPTKKNCENVAQMLCKLMVKYKRELSSVKRKDRKDLLKELHNDSEGKICPVLQYTIHFGVAYHHSGLTVDERKLIEDAYSNGTLCLLTCTSTLAAGVNLPAKRVILRSPYVGQYFISRSQYKQMVGRAGRAGIDSSGESILICKTSDREKVCELLGGPLERCHSSLIYDNGKGLRNLILSTIGLKITTNTEEVFKFMGRSLATIQQQSLGVDISEICKESLQKLIDLGLVLQTNTQSENPENNVVHSLEVTELGKATFKGPVDPDFAGMLYKDLKKAEEPLVISTHLHLLYLVTPYDTAKDVTPSWFTYFNQMNTLTPSELKVASLTGVPESYIARRASQQKSKQKVDEFVVSRFYLTLMLYDLWRQKSVWEVAEKFQQPRGFVQSLLSSAASFASCVAHFCQEMEEFWAYQDLMGNFVKRLSYCVSAELIPLMEIPGVKLGRARLMYTAGYKTLSSVAGVDPDVLVKAVQYLPRKVSKQIVASAKLLLNEKAEAMMAEVEQLVSIPEGPTVPVTMAAIATPALITPGFSQSSFDSQSAVI